MQEDEFTKLFKYMRSEFKQINDKLEDTATKSQVDSLSGALDTYAKDARSRA